MLNKWRYVESGHDGEEVYQCLACGGYLYLASELCGWNYCPYCGTRWEGEHKCRPHGIPKWQHERFGASYPHDLLWKEYEKRKQQELERSQWWLEHRIPGLSTGWICDTRIFAVEPGSWKKVADYLSTERSHHPDNTVEYRAVVKKGQR